jgi:ABC-type phosphate transport system substrate-binding protein
MHRPTRIYRRLKPALVASLWLLCAAGAQADIAVVVHPESPLGNLTRSEVSDIYLGRNRALGDGKNFWVLDQKPDSALRERFFIQLNGMDLRRVNAYWARLQFSGNTQPPRPLADSRQVINTVAGNRYAIGYIDAALVTERVRTVLRLKE